MIEKLVESFSPIPYLIIIKPHEWGNGCYNLIYDYLDNKCYHSGDMRLRNNISDKKLKEFFHSATEHIRNGKAKIQLFKEIDKTDYKILYGFGIIREIEHKEDITTVKIVSFNNFKQEWLSNQTYEHEFSMDITERIIDYDSMEEQPYKYFKGYDKEIIFILKEDKAEQYIEYPFQTRLGVFFNKNKEVIGVNTHTVHNIFSPYKLHKMLKTLCKSNIVDENIEQMTELWNTYYDLNFEEGDISFDSTTEKEFKSIQSMAELLSYLGDD